MHGQALPGKLVEQGQDAETATVLGLIFVGALSGSVVVENIFVLPGLGRLLVTSINNRDFAVVQSVTMLFATGFVVVNMLVDVACAFIDPRTRAR